MTAGAPALTALLDELDRLRAAATPGPWMNDGQEIHRSLGMGAFIEMADLDGWVAETCQPDDMRLTEANAALIVAAVNAVPRLTAAVRAALTLADELDRDAVALPRGGDGAGQHYADGLRQAERDAAYSLRSALTAALEATP